MKIGRWRLSIECFIALEITLVVPWCWFTGTRYTIDSRCPAARLCRFGNTCALSTDSPLPVAHRCGTVVFALVPAAHIQKQHFHRFPFFSQYFWAEREMSGSAAENHVLCIIPRRDKRFTRTRVKNLKPHAPMRLCRPSWRLLPYNNIVPKRGHKTGS